MLVVVIWCFSWSAIGALIAGFIDVDTRNGLIHGLLLGPAGVLVLLLSATEGRKQGRRWTKEAEIAIGNVPLSGVGSEGNEYS